MEHQGASSKENGALIAHTFRSYLSMSILITLSVTLGMMIDNIIAGRIMGSGAVAAIGMSMPMLMLFSGCAGILETGSVALSARALGRRDSVEVNAFFSLALFTGLIVGSVCLLAGHFGSGQIATAMGADDATLHAATQAYIAGLSFAALPIILLQILMGFIRLDGAPQLGLLGILAMSVCDVVFNLIAVLVLDAGLYGMGVSTALAYCVGACVVLTHFAGKKCALGVANPLPYLSKLGTLLKTGAPESLVSLCVMLRTFTYNNLLLIVSTASAVAALSILGSVNNFLSAVSVGVGQTATLLCGIFFGEQDRQAIKGTLRVALKTGLVLCFLLCIAVFAFAPEVVSMFCQKDPDAMAMGTIAVRLYCIAVPFDLANSVFLSYYQSSGNLKAANLISIGMTFACGALFAICTVWFFGDLAIWVSFVFGQAFTLLLQVGIAVFLWAKRSQGKNASQHSGKAVFAADSAGEASACACAEGSCGPHAIADESAGDVEKVTLLDKMLYLPEDFQSDWRSSAAFSCGTSAGDATACSEQVGVWCAENGIDAKRSYLLSLAVEEMAGNIAKHGFKRRKNPAIDVRLIAKADGSVILRIRDNGVGFNPMDYDIDSPDAAGCIGIKLVRSLMTDMDYRSTVGLNNVVITL